MVAEDNHRQQSSRTMNKRRVYFDPCMNCKERVTEIFHVAYRIYVMVSINY